MALQLIARRTHTVSANAAASGQWVQNQVYDYHQMSGLYLMVLEGTGANPPELNLRGPNFNQYSQYGQYIKPDGSPTIQHVTIGESDQIILRGTGPGDGKTTVSFIKLK